MARGEEPAIPALPARLLGWSGTAISLLVATPFHVYAVCG